MKSHHKEDYKKKYNILKQIGFGLYTIVYKGENIETKELRAIKVINLKDFEMQILNNFSGEEANERYNNFINNLKNEMETMKICAENNENSVKYYESFETKNEFVIIMELCDDNLSTYKKRKIFCSEEIYELLTQLNKTFIIMNINSIVHRDLKPDNILIKYEKEIKIFKLCDYGISKIKTDTLLSTYCGTTEYMAPEIIKGEGHNEKCDLWSLGIIIYELYYKERPYKGKSEIVILEQINLLGINKIKKSNNKILDDLISKLLEPNPSKRISWNEYFEHSFFNYNYYSIGIYYGNLFSCVGVSLNEQVHIVPNKMGETMTPSIVCFTDENIDKPLVGEETLGLQIDDKNIIHGVKDFLGLSYDDFIEKKFNKYLNYDVINKNGIPKIKVNLKGKNYFFSAEEISSFIIKKMVGYAADFIDKMVGHAQLTKACIAMPSYFNKKQKDALSNTAKLAGIESSILIDESEAAALGYGIGNNLVSEISKHKLINNKLKSEEDAKILVFKMDGVFLDISKIDISINKYSIISDGRPHLYGSDFDDKLTYYCIQEFSKNNSNKIADIKKDKEACKRLKNKCERARKLLSFSKEVIINIDNFYGQEDFLIKITRDIFKCLCKDIYERIQNIIFESLVHLGIDTKEIEEILLVGGETRIVGIKDLLKRIFGEEKVKDNLIVDEVVALGATLESAKYEKKGEIGLINAYNIGIAVININSKDSELNGLLMSPIVEKYSWLPTLREKFIKQNDSQKVGIKIYEGNNKYVKDNKFLGEMYLDKLEIIGDLEYKVLFCIDVDGQLTASIIVDSMGLKKKEIITKVKRGLKDTILKKIILIKGSNKEIDLDIYARRLKYKHKESKIRKSEENSLNYEELIDYLVSIIKLIILMVQNKDIQLKKLMVQNKENVSDIIQKIKNYMQILIHSSAYLEDILEMFIEFKQIDYLKFVFYEIFINYMELMNEEGISKKLKLYFEREFYACKNFIKEYDIVNMDKLIKDKYEKQKKINEEELKKFHLFSFFIEEKIILRKFIYDNTHFSFIYKSNEKNEKYLNGMTIDEGKEILDKFESMANSFNRDEQSIEEAFCLSHIIIISYRMFKRECKELGEYINRLKVILYAKSVAEYDWSIEAKKNY